MTQANYFSEILWDIENIFSQGNSCFDLDAFMQPLTGNTLTDLSTLDPLTS
jgi:hypothetical protein